MSIQLKIKQKISGIYDIGVEDVAFSGVITEMEEDTAGGGFGRARILLNPGCKFSWEKEDRYSIYATTVKGVLQDDKFRSLTVG